MVKMLLGRLRLTVSSILAGDITQQESSACQDATCCQPPDPTAQIPFLLMAACTARRCPVKLPQAARSLLIQIKKHYEGFPLDSSI